MLKAFRYRLYPTQAQTERMGWTLSRCCELYNAALDERRTAYRKCGVTVNYHAQAVSLPEVKENRPEYRDIRSQVLQDTLRRLDKAFQAFFRRVKQGEKPGCPRFKSARRFDSFCYPQYKGSVGNHVHLPKIGNVRLRLHRPLEGALKTLTVKREVDEWYAVIVCEVEAKPLPATGNTVGIDLGITHFLITSDSEFADNPRHFQKTLKKLRRSQRSLARKKRGGKRRAKQREQVAKLHRKVKRQRLDFHHKTARKLVNENDAIAFENLNIAGMVRSNLARSISDAGWSQFIGILVSKAEEAGRRAITEHPAYSSQRCNRCGYVDRANRPSQAVFRCQSCGHAENADWNAAKNIKAWITPSELNVAVVNASVLREAPPL